MESQLHETEFNQANLTGSDLRECDVSRADFGKADLHAIQLRGLTNYTSANWIGSDIRDIDFTGKELGITIYYNKRRHSFSSTELRKRVFDAEYVRQTKAYKVIDKSLDIQYTKDFDNEFEEHAWQKPKQKQ